MMIIPTMGWIPTVEWITTIVQSLVQTNGGPFLAEGMIWFRYFAIAMFVVKAIQWSLQSVAHGFESCLTDMARFFCLLLLTLTTMRYYAVNLPWTSSTVQGLLPNTARQLCALLSADSMNAAVALVDSSFAKVQAPTNFLHIGEWLTYLSLEFLVWLFEAIMYCLSSVGFVAIGLGCLFGPLLLPFNIIPPLKHLAMGWWEYMISWSCFQLVAAALVWVWAHAVMTAFPLIFNGNFTVLQTVVVLKAMIFFTGAALWSCLYVDRFASKLFGAASAGAAGFAQAIKSYL